MIKYNIKRFIWLIVILSFSVFALLFFVGRHYATFDLRDIWGDIGKTVSAVTILAVLFEKRFWKFPIFKKLLVPVPCLDGIWKGTIKYRVDEDCESLCKLPLFVRNK